MHRETSGAPHRPDPATAGSPTGNLLPNAVPNLRDVGGHLTGDGHRVRTGLAYRSAKLSSPEESAREALAALGLGTVVDLRTAGERSGEPDVLPDGAEYLVLDVLADLADPSTNSFDLTPVVAPDRVPDNPAGASASGSATTDSRTGTMEAIYRQIVTLPSAQAAYAEFFTRLATTEKPLLFHCTAGKDRTGWAAASLLLFLGVPEPVVMKDYLRSNEELGSALQPLIDDYVARGGDPADLADLLGVKSAFLRAANDEVLHRYGSIAKYVSQGLGLSEEIQQGLRARFLVKE